MPSIRLALVAVRTLTAPARSPAAAGRRV